MRDYRKQAIKPIKKSKLPIIIGIFVLLYLASYLIPSEESAPAPANDSQQSIDIILPGQQPATEKNTQLIDDKAIANPVTVSTETKPKADGVTTAKAEVKIIEQHKPEILDTAIQSVQAAETPTVSTHVLTHTIKSGDTLAKVFKSFNLSPSLLHKITHSSKDASKLADVHVGQTISITLNASNDLVSLEHIRSPIESLVITSKNESYQAEIITKTLDTREVESTGIITNSLFVDGQKASLSEKLIMEMVNIFGWDIDFSLELRKGDKFSVIYEEKYLDGEKYQDGNIIAAEFINQNRSFRAFRYEKPNGESEFYDEKGRAMQKAFLRSPVKFSRISSGFTRKRWHPVLKRWRSHKGVDYAAPKGTPIKATGKGKVIFRGWKGGYGNVIFIKHYNKYVTVYGHLSKFRRSVKNGSFVKQGQTIGYVGQTGLATGPHLHYEMRVNGVHRNPLKVKLPNAVPLEKKYRTDYQNNIKTMITRLNSISANDQIAHTKPEKND